MFSLRGEKSAPKGASRRRGGALPPPAFFDKDSAETLPVEDVLAGLIQAAETPAETSGTEETPEAEKASGKEESPAENPKAAYKATEAVDMACDCRPNIPRYRASSAAVASGVTTVTIPGSPAIEPGEVIDVILATAIPDGTDGTAVSITNGTVTGYVMNGNGNYLRPASLTSRTVLRVQYLADPAHFQIIGIYGRRLRCVCRCS